MLDGEIISCEKIYGMHADEAESCGKKGERKDAPGAARRALVRYIYLDNRSRFRRRDWNTIWTMVMGSPTEIFNIVVLILNDDE